MLKVEVLKAKQKNESWVILKKDGDFVDRLKVRKEKNKLVELLKMLKAGFEIVDEGGTQE